ncbi:hypothetical protein LRS13_07105 [Svornostia abyssi]|uniref:Uncharacterized protein n=1 Tax=Svornostia abyssi TaxID=2898438 RepID=A0ABY5PKR3_9ACTN|nr:hypothetical protein LRS13_07105 [Parviterribacteraceae bacterium J379]
MEIVAGRRPSIGGSLRSALSRTLPLVAAAFLYGVVVVLGVIALIIPGIWLGVACYFAAQHVAYDREMGAIAAIGASYDLVKGSWWWTFGVLIVVGIVSAVVLVPAIIVVAAGTMVIGGVAGGVLYIATLIIANTIVYSFGALAGTLLFFDLRARRGIDVPPPGAGPIRTGAGTPGVRLEPRPAGAATGSVCANTRRIRLQLVEHEADGLVADPRKRAAHVRQREVRRGLLEDEPPDAVLLAGPGVPARAGDALLEPFIGGRDRPDQVLGPRPDRVLRLVPCALRGVQRGVVRVLGLEDLLLETDKSRDAVAEPEELVGRDEAREASVAIRDRMDRQEIEDERRHHHERMRCHGRLGIEVALDELGSHGGCLGGGHGGEDHLATPGLVGDDGVVLALEVPAPPLVVGEQPTMEVEEQGNGDGLGLGPEQLVHRVPVSGELSLVAIAKARSAGDGSRTILGDVHPFDGVRRPDRRDARVLGERAQELGHLVGEEFLATARDITTLEQDTQARWLCPEGAVEVDEALHANPAVNVLIAAAISTFSARLSRFAKREEGGEAEFFRLNREAPGRVIQRSPGVFAGYSDTGTDRSSAVRMMRDCSVAWAAG